jgi:type VI secretion system protein ImpK
MHADSYVNSFLFQTFESFYTEIIKIKQRALISRSNDGDAEMIQARIEAFFKIQSDKILQKGGKFSYGRYKEAELVMVALVDEIFLNLPWNGKRFWEKNLLEAKIYQTHRSGELFFSKLDEFLKNTDSSNSDMAAVYLQALTLGFLGKYRDQDMSDIKEYILKLYQRVTNQNLTEIVEHPIHVIAHGEIRRMPDPKIWYLVFSVVGVAFVLFSYGLWYGAIHNIQLITKALIKKWEFIR